MSNEKLRDGFDVWWANRFPDGSVDKEYLYEAFLAGAASNRNTILQEAAEALEKFTGPGHPELTEVILKLRNK